MEMRGRVEILIVFFAWSERVVSEAAWTCLAAFFAFCQREPLHTCVYSLSRCVVMRELPLAPALRLQCERPLLCFPTVSLRRGHLSKTGRAVTDWRAAHVTAR